TRPVLSGPAVERVNDSDLDSLVVTDTIPLQDPAAACGRIRQLSVAPILAETIRRISNDDSVSSLFID
ncbi:MAG: ribose-phosphate pyrophosphokinase, partial [Azovibrio sp.]|nr:ribose-phosphate pyrophosphokinase [Azovibrio sp.]